MTGAHLRIFRNSYRWFAPALAFMLTLSLSMSGSSPWLSVTPLLFPAFLVWGVWATLAFGNPLDRGVRDLLSARAGSTGRQHQIVALSVGIAGLVPLCLLLAYGAIVSGQDWGQAVLATLLSSVSGLALGIGIGTWFHRPVVTNRAISIFGAILPMIFVLRLGLVTGPLSSIPDGELVPAALLALASLAVLVLSCTLTGLIAQRRAATG